VEVITEYTRSSYPYNHFSEDKRLSPPHDAEEGPLIQTQVWSISRLTIAPHAFCTGTCRVMWGMISLQYPPGDPPIPPVPFVLLGYRPLGAGANQRPELCRMSTSRGVCGGSMAFTRLCDVLVLRTSYYYVRTRTRTSTAVLIEPSLMDQSVYFRGHILRETPRARAVILSYRGEVLRMLLHVRSTPYGGSSTSIHG
jgi:hypothetical protein